MLTFRSDYTKNRSCRCFQYILKALVVFILSQYCGAIVFAANKPATDAVNYADSIRNGNVVYSEREAGRLLYYLERLEKTSLPDSLRLYATEGMLNYSWYLMNCHEWFLCGKLLEGARKYCPPQSSSLMCQIETGIAGIYMYNENYNEASSIFLRTNEFFRSRQDTVEWLKSCVNLGLCYSKMHNKSKALDCYRQVLDVAGSDSRYENYYSIVTGYAENVEEDSVINLSTFEKALRLSLDNGYTYLLASNYNDLARYYFRMENYHEALANARKGLKYADKFSQDNMKRAAYSLMAEIYYTQKNYVSAYNMLALKNVLAEKSAEGMGRRYYAHLARVDSILTWVEAHVEIPTERLKTEGGGKRLGEDLLYYILIFLVSVLTGVIGFFIGRRFVRKPEYIAEPEDGTGETVTSSDISDDAYALNIIAESFNPMLDRVRGMLKDVQKTGDPAADSRLRGIMAYLLQSRLPDMDNQLTKSLKEEETRFSERLSSAYPTLTKNDLRMALYIRSGLSHQAVSSLSGLQPKSVSQARYRLRKSLGLGQDDSLEEFIKSF